MQWSGFVFPFRLPLLQLSISNSPYIYPYVIHGLSMVVIIPITLWKCFTRSQAGKAQPNLEFHTLNCWVNCRWPQWGGNNIRPFISPSIAILKSSSKPIRMLSPLYLPTPLHHQLRPIPLHTALQALRGTFLLDSCHDPVFIKYQDHHLHGQRPAQL